MNKPLLLLATLLCSGTAAGDDTLELGNDPWPPFILPGEALGKAEALVTEALERSGWQATIETGDWAEMLASARAGELDGIAALWHTADREQDLLFSRPYLTNRIVPVVKHGSLVIVTGLTDLTGLRVALERDAAYGDAIDAARPLMTIEDVTSVEGALQAVRDGVADVALVDELIARDYLAEHEKTGLVAKDVVLAYRELHFAVHRDHPEAAAIVEGFNSAYDAMVRDGSVNRILDVDWLATDLEGDGRLDLVMRGDLGLDALDDPAALGATYALDQDHHQALRANDFDYGGFNYRVDGVDHDDVGSAVTTKFGEDSACSFDRWQTVIRCTPKALNR